MKIGLRILLGYFLIVGLAAWFLLNVFVQEVKPGARATLEAAMLSIITLLVWLPPLLAHPHDSDAWSAFLMSSAIAAGAAAMADSYRGIGWATRGSRP